MTPEISLARGNMTKWETAPHVRGISSLPAGGSLQLSPRPKRLDALDTASAEEGDSRGHQPSVERYDWG